MLLLFRVHRHHRLQLLVVKTHISTDDCDNQKVGPCIEDGREGGGAEWLWCVSLYHMITWVFYFFLPGGTPDGFQDQVSFNRKKTKTFSCISLDGVLATACAPNRWSLDCKTNMLRNTRLRHMCLNHAMAALLFYFIFWWKSWKMRLCQFAIFLVHIPLYVTSYYCYADRASHFLPSACLLALPCLLCMLPKLNIFRRNAKAVATPIATSVCPSVKEVDCAKTVWARVVTLVKW